jgi:hypothetical protein
MLVQVSPSHAHKGHTACLLARTSSQLLHVRVGLCQLPSLADVSLQTWYVCCPTRCSMHFRFSHSIFICTHSITRTATTGRYHDPSRDTRATPPAHVLATHASTGPDGISDLWLLTIDEDSFCCCCCCCSMAATQHKQTCVMLGYASASTSTHPAAQPCPWQANHVQQLLLPTAGCPLGQHPTA